MKDVMEVTLITVFVTAIGAMVVLMCAMASIEAEIAANSGLVVASGQVVDIERVLAGSLCHLRYHKNVSFDSGESVLMLEKNCTDIDVGDYGVIVRKGGKYVWTEFGGERQ